MVSDDWDGSVDGPCFEGEKSVDLPLFLVHIVVRNLCVMLRSCCVTMRINSEIATCSDYL